MARLSAGLLLALWMGSAVPVWGAARFAVDERDTLAAFVEALRVAREEVGTGTASAEEVREFEDRLRRVERPSAAAGPVDVVTLSRATTSADAARDMAARIDWLDGDLQGLLEFYGFVLEPGVRQLADTETSTRIQTRVQNVRAPRTARAQQEGLARLRRYEVKYGPGAPRLNFAEVLLNAGLQRVSVFAPGRDGPSPYEALLAYSTTFFTLDEARDAKAVSVLEAGIRRYTFSWNPQGPGGWLRLLKPRYLSLGVVVAEERDGALRWPLEDLGHDTTRVGPYLTWGDLKLGWLLGPHSRFMVSRQVHLIPNVL